MPCVRGQHAVCEGFYSRTGDTSLTFGKWLFSNHHKNLTTICHNMKGYDGYFLLEYLIDQSMRPDKIIYNGPKIMYMTVEKDLHIKVIDSLNFLPMKLSKLPEVFGLKELRIGLVPPFLQYPGEPTVRRTLPRPPILWM